jgi:hypothetical protein
MGIECAITTVVVLSSGPSRKTLRFRASRGWTGGGTLVNLKPEPVKASGADEDEMQMLADLIIGVPVRASTFQLLDEA